MKIFISYSAEDFALVRKLADAIISIAEVYYWDKDKVLGKDSWITIFSWIDAADLVVAVITDSTVSRAMAVGQEVGHAKAKGKVIIPLVAEGVHKSELGCLEGVTYEVFSKDNFDRAIQKTKQTIMSIKQKEDQQTALILIGFFIAILFLSSRE